MFYLKLTIAIGLHLWEYIKKKSKEIRVSADFSTALNDTLKNYYYPLLGPEEVFAQFSGFGYFRKST